MPLKTILAELGINQQTLCSQCGFSRPAASRLVRHGKWPAKFTQHRYQQLVDCLRGHGATKKHWKQLLRSGLFDVWELPPETRN